MYDKHKSAKTPDGGPALRPQAIVRNLADVQPEVLKWLWPGRIPLGKLTLLAGDPGLGKSFLTLDLAARVSCGAGLPDNPSSPRRTGAVVILSAEDGLADTIRPRLDAAGADVSRIIAIEGVALFDDEKAKQGARMFSLEADLPRLEEVLAETHEVILVIIDPVSAYCGSVDSHKNADVRALLAPLADLAAKFKVAVIVVTHLSKGAGGKAVYRAMGSLAFAAAARAVWYVGQDPDCESRRLMLPAKMNIAKNPTGLAYSIVDGVVVWEADPVEMTADDALAAETAKKEGNPTKAKEVAEWLRGLLSTGDLASKDVLKQARDCGYSQATLRRAKDVAGVRTEKRECGVWWWTLRRNADGDTSSADAQAAQDEHLEQLAEFRGNSDDSGPEPEQDAQPGDGEHLEPLDAGNGWRAI